MTHLGHTGLSRVGGWTETDYPPYQTIQTLSFVQHGFSPVQNPNLSKNPVKWGFLGTYNLSLYIILGGGCFILCVVYVYRFAEAKAYLTSHFSGASHLVFIERVRVSP